MKLDEILGRYILVNFYWNGGEDGALVLMERGVSIEQLERLLSEYRERDPDFYNIHDFVDYLEEKGIDAYLLTFYYNRDEIDSDISVPF